MLTNEKCEALRRLIFPDPTARDLYHNLAGPDNRHKRREVIRLCTGERRAVATCGIAQTRAALRAALDIPADACSAKADDLIVDVLSPAGSVEPVVEPKPSYPPALNTAGNPDALVVSSMKLDEFRAALDEIDAEIVKAESRGRDVSALCLKRRDLVDAWRKF